MSKNISSSEKRKDINANFTQNNILIENEINAIGKLPELLADRAMVLLEKTTEHKMDIDHKIIQLEENNQNIAKEDMKRFYIWYGFGLLGAYLVIFLSIIACIILAYNDKTISAVAGIIPGILTALTQAAKMLKSKNRK